MPQNDSLADLVARLIEFKTVKENTAEISRCLDFVENYFNGSSLRMVKLETNGAKSLLVLKNTDTPKIFLCGHLDVVAGDDEQFKARLENGRLYGRGALDMKSGCAVLMQLMKEFARTDHDIGLMLTTDEETGGFNGTKYVLEQGYRPKTAILPDGGKAPDMIVQKAKGVMWIRLTARGKTAHASTPWKGTNAIDDLLQAVKQVQACFMPPAACPDDHWKATCSLGLIEGGTATNQVPDAASATCDIRYTENDDPKKILQSIKDAAGPKIQIEQIICEPLSCTNLDSPALAAYQDAVRDQDLEPKLVADHGSSDARFFSALGIPVIMSQPRGDNHHGKNEWVDIESMDIYYQLIKKFLDKTARPS